MGRTSATNVHQIHKLVTGFNRRTPDSNVICGNNQYSNNQHGKNRNGNKYGIKIYNLRSGKHDTQRDAKDVDF